MKAVPQVILYLATFAIVFILGNLLDIAFWQARFHVKHILGNRPLPVMTQFFMDHHHLPAHLVLLPWIALIGAPLLTFSRARNYWDSPSFLLRFLAFLSVEFALFLVLLLALWIPFIPYYAVLEPFRQSTTELAIRIVFWSGVVVTATLAVRRIIQIRNERSG